MYAMQKTTLPEWFVKNISLSFGVKYDSPEAFNQAIATENSWEPHSVVLPGVTQIGLFWNGRYNVIKSSNPEGFTALDLLFKTNNIVAEVMRQVEDHSYEGFSFMSVDGNGLARYALQVS